MSGSLPVLVVDDEVLLLSFFKAALARNGVEVFVASSADQALQLLERGDFAGVISDLRMESCLDGARVYDWVRKNRPELSRRFVFMSGDVGAPFAVELRERTGAPFLEKPFRIRELLEVIRRITGRDQCYA